MEVFSGSSKPGDLLKQNTLLWSFFFSHLLFLIWNLKCEKCGLFVFWNQIQRQIQQPVTFSVFHWMNVDWSGKDTAPPKAQVWWWVASCTAGLPSPSRFCGIRSLLFVFEGPQCPSSLSGWRDLYHLRCLRAPQEELVQALIQGDSTSRFGIQITSSSANIVKNEHTSHRRDQI